MAVTGTPISSSDTLDAVKEYLRISSSNDDTLLNNLIARAEDEADMYCHRVFAAATYTEYYDGNGLSKMNLKHYPVNSITSIHDDLDREYGADDLIDSDDYVFEADSGIVKLDGLTFTGGIQNIKVIYNAGYATLPDDVTDAIVKLVAAKYLLGQGAINAIEGEENFGRPAGLRKQALLILDKYLKYA